MTDFMTPEQRSRVMSSVRSRDTKAELLIRSGLHRLGFRFRKNVRNLPGSPDIVLPRYHAVIFVHGCFWHGHEGCTKSKIPSTRIDFWQSKLSANRERDGINIDLLKAAGWRVAVVWECGTKSVAKFNETITSLAEWLYSSDPGFHPEPWAIVFRPSRAGCRILAASGSCAGRGWGGISTPGYSHSPPSISPGQSSPLKTQTDTEPHAPSKP